MPEEFKRWLEDLRVDWRDLRGEVMKVLQWQAETRPKCAQHAEILADHEKRIRASEKRDMDLASELQRSTSTIEKYKGQTDVGLSVGTKALAFIGWLTAVGLAIAGWFVK